MDAMFNSLKLWSSIMDAGLWDDVITLIFWVLNVKGENGEIIC